MTVQKPSLFQVGSGTQSTKGSSVRNNSICVQLYYQQGHSVLILNFFIRLQEGHVHEERMRLRSRILSSTLTLPQLKQTGKGRFWFSIAGKYSANFTWWHDRKATRVSSLNVGTNLLLNAVRRRISKLSGSPARRHHGDTH